MNKVKLVGRLTRDPELSERSGHKVCDMRLAVNGAGSSPPLFVDVVAFGERATHGAELRKGALVEIDGSLRYSEWEADEGTEKTRRRSKHSVVVQGLIAA